MAAREACRHTLCVWVPGQEVSELSTKEVSCGPDVAGRPEGHAVVTTCFELVDALDGLFVAEKRSATLDGAIPLRAAQGCKPFLDGNEAGYQLRMAEPALVRLVEGGFEFHVGERFAAGLGEGYEDSLERLVAGGLLCRDGYWHRALGRGVGWVDGDRVCLWTGLLIRAAADTRVLQTGAFNRRVRATVEDCVIADEDGFVPVVLELAVSSFVGGELWLDTEVACLLPVWADVDVDVCPLEADPSVGDRFLRFYSQDYIDKRVARGVAGKYRRLVAGERDDGWERGGRSRLVFAGPDAHTIERFHRFATAAGVSPVDPSGRGPVFAVVRNIGRVSATFDGITVRDVAFDVADIVAHAREQFFRTCGMEVADLFAGSLASYANGISPPGMEPRFVIKPWAFMRTPPGWSSVLDGVHHGVAEGLRGVQSTDSYHGIGTTMEFVKPASFTIETGEALDRVLPVPRALLRAPFRQVTITEAAQ